MGDDVIIGYDGKPRCAWAGAGDNALGRYHDEVWGSRTYDESALFEALTLGVFEAGLSWSIVFGKRDGSGGPSRPSTRAGRGDDGAGHRPARQLKSQGYRFVGPTSVYAFMQNVGVVNDHIRLLRATDD